MQRSLERAALVKALSTVALTDRRRSTRRFLQGLATDELRYIASYLGACMIECDARTGAGSRNQIAWEIVHYECCREHERGAPSFVAIDREHKMILLLEYLSSCHSGAALRVPAGSA